MIAKLEALLPFSITIPEGEKFPIHEYTDSGCKIRIYPPIKVTNASPSDDIDSISINGTKAYMANVLRIYFLKDKFNRSDKIECDPPYELIGRTINFFLLKVRFITKGSKIRPINFPSGTWNLEYLNDDESQLEKGKGLVRGRLSREFKFGWTAVNKDIWNYIFNLPPNYVPPKWDSLILDANEMLPEIGPSLVLVTTALEVFISQILSNLFQQSSIPKELWNWINDRGFSLKEPSLEEQFDALLKIIGNFSLKENKQLWEAFRNLKDARNSFVHEGIAKVGNNPVSGDQAKKLMTKANEIIKYIRDKLPKQLQWPEYKYKIRVQVSKKIFDNKK